MHNRPLLISTVVAAALLAGCTSTPAPTPAPAGSVAPSASPAGPDYSVWNAGKSVLTAEPLYPKHGTADVDVLHYGLDLDWKPETKTLTGKATIRMRAASDLKEVRLDFSAYQIDAVTLDGAAVTGTVVDEKLTVPAALAKEQLATLVVSYHGSPKPVKAPTRRADADEGLGMHSTKDGSLWTMQEPYGAFTWYPVNDQPSDKALYDIAITAPTGWAGVASGTPAGQEGNTYRYKATDPVASYLTTLAVSKYKKETATGPHGLPLTYWYRPGVDDEMMKYVRKSPQYITWLEKRFGPYPFPSGGIVIVASESGMETQQMITMGKPPVKDAKERARIWEEDLLHEYAHQWFGDSVTTSTWKDLWLNEGWAMYAQYLYQKEKQGYSWSTWETWARDRDAAMRARSGAPGKPNPKYFAESNVYICPAVMLRQIHKQIGDAKFFAMAQAWTQEQRNSSQDRASFIAFVNKQTGKDFTKLINTWLDSPKTP